MTLPIVEPRAALLEPPGLNPAVTADWLVAFLRDELVLRRKILRAFIGLSGGVDSAVTAFLCARALGPENVYATVRRLRRTLGDAVPEGWSPHWARHTHATALLLAGVPEHVVMRRLGHADIQTTIDLYGWVTEDAELRAVAGWKSFCEGWRVSDG